MDTSKNSGPISLDFEVVAHLHLYYCQGLFGGTLVSIKLSQLVSVCGAQSSEGITWCIEPSCLPVDIAKNCLFLCLTFDTEN